MFVSLPTLSSYLKVCESFCRHFFPYLHPIIYGAYGNNATCTLQGFILTVGFSVPMYNAVLCLYYMAVIRYNLKEDMLKKMEPYAHAVALLIPLGIGIYGVAANLFHPTHSGKLMSLCLHCFSLSTNFISYYYLFSFFLSIELIHRLLLWWKRLSSP